jgi:methionyl-tRNA formyltransferase
MRIVFLTQDDPVYILPFFEEFFRQELGNVQVLGIFSCKTMGDRGRVRLLQELFCLYGPMGFTRLAFRRLVAKGLGLLPAANSWKRFYSIAQVSRAMGVEYEAIGNPNHQGCAGRIARLKPDLLVSVACPYILKEKLLSLPPRGCINVHHAPLPRYKGMMPTFWQMYHGEKKVGITIHTMAARVDEGKALLQEQLPIRDGESLDSLIRRSKQHGAVCMLRVLRQLARQTLSGSALDDQAGSYFTFPTYAEMKEFRRRGFRAI